MKSFKQLVIVAKLSTLDVRGDLAMPLRIKWSFRMNINNIAVKLKLFYDRGLYHIETSLLICYENQWTGFYMIETYVIKRNKAKKSLL